LICKVCGQSHQCVINSIFIPSGNVIDVDLSAPIDVYSDWIDAAEAVGRDAGPANGAERDDEYEEDGVEA